MMSRLLPEILSILKIILLTKAFNENDPLNQSLEQDRLLITEPTESQIISIFWDERTNKYDIKNGTISGRVAWANFTNQIEQNGWSFLKIVTEEHAPDDVQAYAAGLAEGHLTTELIRNYWLNMIDRLCDDSGDPDFCDKLEEFLNNNWKWMKSKIKTSSGSDPYWHQVDLILKQLQGLEDGCQGPIIGEDRHSVLKNFGFLILNILVDIDDLGSALRKKDLNNKKPGSCSALIKLLPNNSDLYVSHTTWDDYSGMIRCLKKYEFNYHLSDFPGSKLVPGNKMTFSSYPGNIHSSDDFYIISNTYLVTMETTIENYNEELWKFVKPSSLLEFVRSMLANRMATDGHSWTEIFAEHNSGTYNNQWMIIDYKKFQPKEAKLKPGLLWIIEQLPGFVESEDMTEILQNQTYWASYNTPNLPWIYVLSGTQAKTEKQGDFYSNNKNPRALIFARDHHKVVDIDTMIKLMRSNDYKNDPLAICNCTPTHNAMNAIAARGDLNPVNGTYEFDDLAEMAYGATDMKLTNAKLMQTLQFFAYSGPTFDQQPPFQWSKYSKEKDEFHVGQPDLWNFSTIITKWE